MSWAVDTPIQIGDSIFAAIVEFTVSARTAGPAVTGMARKQPLLVLQIKGSWVSGLDINGHAYEADEIELLYPTAVAQIYARHEESS